MYDPVITIRLPEAIVQQIDSLIADGEFGTRAEFVKYAVRQTLKRYEGRTNLIEGPDFLLDQQTYTLYIHNTSVVLPKNQGKLLVALLSGGDALVTTEQLCMALWGTTEYIDENALQVNLTRLKKTMSGLEMKQRIVAVRGMGYRLEAEVSP